MPNPHAPLVACSVEINLDDLHRIQLFPEGVFTTSDGRGPFRMSRAISEPLIKAFQQELAVDWEHQTIHSQQNGKPAPASGWIQKLEYVDGEGLFARVRWTELATQQIKAGHYRYISPTFLARDGVPYRLAPPALTNHPAILGMQPVAASTQQKDHAMEELLMALRAFLGLAEDANAEAVLAAWKSKADTIKMGEPVAAAVDLSKFSPISVIQELQGELAALRAQFNEGEASALIEGALKEGRLIPAQKGWAEGLAKQNLQALKGFISTAPVVASNTPQTDPPVLDVTGKLTPEELQVCSALGISHEAFVKQKEAK